MKHSKRDLLNFAIRTTTLAFLFIAMNEAFNFFSITNYSSEIMTIKLVEDLKFPFSMWLSYLFLGRNKQENISGAEKELVEKLQKKKDWLSVTKEIEKLK